MLRWAVIPSFSRQTPSCLGGAIAALLAQSFVLCVSEAKAVEHRHDLGVGYQSGHINGEDAGSFHFRSLPVSYLGRLGGDLGVEIRIAALVPLRARQEDVKFAPRKEYERTQQYDALVGPSYRLTEFLNWKIDAGLGPHFHYVRFQSTEYVEWSSAALGLGASTTGRTPITKELPAGHGEFGVRGDFSYDFIDLSRGGHMNGGLQAQVLLFVGWAMGGKR